MSRSLNDLEPIFRARCFELLARLAEARVPVVIVNTRRTAEEQALNIKRGVSWVTHSKHEDGLAIDVCLYDTYDVHGDYKLDWNTNDPAWETIGRIGEDLGLVWGGRWKQKDMGHFEALESKPAARSTT